MPLMCNTCKLALKIGLSCGTCQDYKLCPSCYGKNGHEHTMQQVVLMLSTDVFPQNNDPNVCPSQVQHHPLSGFIQNMATLYKSSNDQLRGACQFIFDHFVGTCLVCGCFFCKKVFNLYKYHCVKCQVPYCNLKNCNVIDGQINKRPVRNMNEDVLMQKLMQIRVIMKRAIDAKQGASDTTRNPSLLRKFTIQRCIRTLVHASQCVEANCMPASCQKMKRILSHIKICKRKVSGGCMVCKQLCTLCCYHAKTCTESKCSVVLCPQIKRRLKEAKIKKGIPV